MAHLVGPGEADDLTQEIYLRAMRALPAFDARSTRAHLAAGDRPAGLRRPHPLRVAPPAAGRRSTTGSRSPRRSWPATTAAGFEAGFALTELIRALDPDRREAFVATQIAGLSYAEAAEVCGCPVGTIRSRVARAREDLVAAMNADRTVRRLRPSS